MQLNKYLAHAGMASRRKAVELIESGVVLINGIVIKEPWYQVKPSDVVTVNDKTISKERKLYILLNKPKGYISTVTDERDRKTVVDLLRPKIRERVYPIGRLDRDTTGLLLLTNDGEFAHKLAHPRYQVEKVYVVTLGNPFVPTDAQKLRAGIRLSDGVVSVDDIAIIPESKRYKLRVTLHSGKYRIIRRMFQALGYLVTKLDRVRYAHLTKRGLSLGSWRMLTKDELEEFVSKK